jgi:D-serine deaminase-like pyridoxal phosphate-dependent protein
MKGKASRQGIHFRPHFKSHNSAEVAKWFEEAGTDAITVSSVTMASYFAAQGWKDITIAFPLNIREIDKINLLAGQVKLNLLIEHSETISFLVEKLKFPAGFFIKIDTGYNRTGISPNRTDLIDQILHIASIRKDLFFKGFLTHSGQTYQASGRTEISRIHKQSTVILRELKNYYKILFPDLWLSIGDTPSCSVAEDFEGIDEIRPGNFVYYDLMQVQIGSCDYRDIAVVVACPVVAKHQERMEIVIYGGAVHLSKEFLNDQNGTRIFGMITEFHESGWSEPVKNVWLASLSQEHGIISSPNSEFFDKATVGDLILILPVHSCLTANILEDQIII